MTITLTPEDERIIHAQLAQAQGAAETIRELRKGVTLDRPDETTLREYAHIGHKY